MKAAINVFADPGSEEAVGRVFNALAAAYDFKEKGDEVKVFFQGAGTRWPAALADAEHPVHGLYELVKDVVAGVSAGCADVFLGDDNADTCGCDLVGDNKVPGTSGLPSIQKLIAEGYTVLTF